MDSPFLDSGTRQLVEDMGRFSELIDATAKLSLYGISYGTTVMGTFATMLPTYVDLFIVDGSVYVKAGWMF